MAKLRNQGAGMPVGEDYGKSIAVRSRQMTLTEMIDEQIEIHKNRIRDLEEAKAAVTPEIEKALNALAKL